MLGGSDLKMPMVARMAVEWQRKRDMKSRRNRAVAAASGRREARREKKICAEATGSGTRIRKRNVIEMRDVDRR
jgi:hypothetical protein